MASDGIFRIKAGDGISQAIAKELNLDKSLWKKVDWKSVFELVNQAKEDSNSSVSWGGGNELHKECCTGNYMVNDGDEFKFSAEIWKKIANVVKESLEQKGISVENLDMPETEEVTPPVEEVPEETPPATNEPARQFVMAKALKPELLEKYQRYALREVDESKTKTKDRFFGLFGTKELKYDSEGRLISKTTTNKRGKKAEILYDKDGMAMRRTKRDKDGNVTSIREIDTDGASTLYKERTMPLLMGNNRRYSTLSSDIININRDNYSHFDDGSLWYFTDTETHKNGKTRRMINLNEDGSISSISAAEYDKNEKNISCTWYSANGDVSIFVTYDNQGRRIQESRYDKNPQYHIIYEYEGDSTEPSSTKKYYLNGTPMSE